MKYRLEVLNDSDFEELCQAILEVQLKITLQNFKKGKDGGIDLRYSTDIENKIVIQAKHFIKSKFSDLKSQLKDEVTKNLKKMHPQPERYIVCTSLELNPSETQQLVSLLHPFCKSTRDIYSRNRIETLLNKMPGIEERFYKLWITSTTILKRVLFNGVKGNSIFYEQKILDKVKLYVPTVNFTDAEEKLKLNGFILVTGEPGVGKTTISYLLICDLLAKGFELVYITDKISHADDVVSIDPAKKQVFFFDDFFGANLYEILNPRNSEVAIISFIEKIRMMPNKYLILTSRTTILNQAKHNYEKFSRSRLSEQSNYIVEVKQYSKFNKAKILYNHLYHSNLDIEQQEAFIKDKNYLKIINHKNFFPRLIEFITSSNELRDKNTSEIVEFIFNSLENPNEIWRYAFESQLTDEDRFLLFSLFSLGAYNVPLDALEAAFEERYKYEIKENGFKRKTDCFNRSLKKLSEAFIYSQKNYPTGNLTISLSNPSIGDFMINYLSQNTDEQKRILYSAKYFEQLTNYFHPLGNQRIKFTEEYLLEFYEIFLHRCNTMQSLKWEKADQIFRLYNLILYFEPIVTEEVLIDVFNKIDFANLPDITFHELKYSFEYLKDYSKIKRTIKDNWAVIFTGMVPTCEDSTDFKDLLRFLDNYGITKEMWSTDAVFVDELKLSINFRFEDFNKDVDISSREDRILESYHEGFPGDATSIITDIIGDEYFSFLSECNLSDFHDDFVQDVSFNEESLLSNVLERHAYTDDYEPTSFSARPEPLDTDAQIEDLFEK